MYRMRWSRRAFCVVFSSLSAFFFFMIWGGSILGTREATPVELYGSAGLLLGGGLFLARTFRNVLILSSTAAELRSHFDRNTLPLSR